MADTRENDLDTLLKQLQDVSWSTLLPDELKLLIEAFLPDQPHSLRSKAYIVLSALCQRFRDKQPLNGQEDPASDAITRLFAPAVTAKLGDTIEKEALSGLCFLSALFQVHWQAAAAVLTREGVVETVIDALDLFPSSLPIARAIAQLVSQAAGHKSSRAVIPRQCIDWLEAKSRQSNDDTLKAAAAVALVKLSRGASSDAAAVTGAEPTKLPADSDLVGMMKSLLISNHDSSSLNDAVEGLAYISTNTSVKETLSKDKQFLTRLFAIIPRRKGRDAQPLDADSLAVTPIYGTVLIIGNICAYRPQLTEEEAQIAKLRRMASAASATGEKLKEEGADPLEDDRHVRERARRLLEAGVMGALTAAVHATDSKATRLVVGKALLSLIEDQENRGSVLQAGGAKALLTIVQNVLPAKPSSAKAEDLPPLSREEIEPIQALAKLSITASPLQVFGPNQGALFDAIRPLSIMLLHSSSKLLQRFEAMMALTNLSSSSPEAASRIGNYPGLMNKVELLMLENHTLIRRAATELVCNLVAGCEDVYDRYGGEKTGGAKSKLHVLLALCDVEDVQTRLAASGALAAVTSSPHACQSLLQLQDEKHRVLPILGQLIDPSIKIPRDAEEDDEVEEIRTPGTADQDPDLVHRGVVCVRNFFVGLDVSSVKRLGMEAQEIGIVQALVNVFRRSASNPGNPVVRPAAEALKALMESGLSITP